MRVRLAGVSLRGVDDEVLGVVFKAVRFRGVGVRGWVVSVSWDWEDGVGFWEGILRLRIARFCAVKRKPLTRTGGDTENTIVSNFARFVDQMSRCARTRFLFFVFSRMTAQVRFHRFQSAQKSWQESVYKKNGSSKTPKC